MPGNKNVVLIGPTAVVFPTLIVNLLILLLLVRTGGEFNRLGGSVGVATTGFLGSFLTIFVMTIAVNLIIANIAHF